MGSKRGQVTAKPETPAQVLGRLVRQQRKLMGLSQEALGALRREPRGAVFEYNPEFLRVCERRGWGLGFRVPLAVRVRTEGVNLHTFFAGLLPEGLRLGALIRSVKTSAEDLLSLLLAAGSETVGDVRVTDVSEPVLPVVDAERLTRSRRTWRHDRPELWFPARTIRLASSGDPDSPSRCGRFWVFLIFRVGVGRSFEPRRPGSSTPQGGTEESGLRSQAECSSIALLLSRESETREGRQLSGPAGVMSE